MGINTQRVRRANEKHVLCNHYNIFNFVYFICMYMKLKE